MPKSFRINIYKNLKITVTNINILKRNSLHYALNHFFSCFSIRKSKNQNSTQKTLCCFSKSNMKFEK